MMIPEQEIGANRLDDTFAVSERRVSCDGGGQVFGHPKVWYDLSHEDEVVCEYCGRRFVYRAVGQAGSFRDSDSFG